MNPAHVHLMLNHVPLFGAVAVTILCALALLRRQQGLARGGLVVAVLTAIVGLVVYLTGEPAEELVENLPGVSEAVLESHEEIALIATIVLGGYGIVALAGLVAFRHGVTMRFTRILLVASLVPLATIAYTAYLGGQVRHSEIRPNGNGGVSGDDASSRGVAMAYAASGAHFEFQDDTLRIPPSIREEHAALRRALEQGGREPGALGAAVRELAARMEPHFVKEEELALPPLAVLPVLAGGRPIPDRARIVDLATRLEAQLPTMIEEHRSIGEAVAVMVAAADPANRPYIAELGEEILHHARSEEEITYPAAVLVGRYLRLAPDS